MNTSMNWIKEYVPDLDCTPKEWTDAVTLTGTKVETCSILNKNLDKIVTGQIKSMEKHPDSDHLWICQVDVGQAEPVQIVTGAQNQKVGDVVPVVLDGGKVAGGHDGGELPEDGVVIKAGKLRGIESYGMMCSIEELGSSREFYPEAPEDGLYIFPEGTQVGQDAPALLGFNDAIHEYEITSNRVDCYSVIGIAREGAATFKKAFHMPKEEKSGNNEDINDYLSVEVIDTDLCPRYTARMVKNIKIAPSPKWMQIRLASAGIRPINNIVDITNYVMLEYGQPMHSYDYDKIRGHKIIVKRAADGDVFETLDQQERKLDHTILTICDAEGAIGLAGIMGGQNSKITDDVKTMVFEAATFDGTNIRLSARKVGDRTDASAYFEKGLDPNLAESAINRACALIEELQAGEVVGGMIDVYPVKREPSVVVCKASDINSLIGFNLTAEEMKEYLERIELSTEIGADGDTLTVTAPTFRQDIHRMCDVAEEITRFYGYANVPTTLPGGSDVAGRLAPDLAVNERVRHYAQALGYSQAFMYSFESPKVYDKLLFPEDAAEKQQIRISNPLGEDFSVMRTSSLNGMLTALSTNYNRRNKSAKLYEMANVYIPKALPLTELPDERMTLTLGFIGEGDFFTMKGDVEDILNQLGILGRFKYDAEGCAKPFLHPGRRANIIYDGKVIGFLGEIHPTVLENYSIGDKAYVAVLDMPEVYPLVNDDTKYTPLAKFPSVTRDFSMLVPLDVTAGQIEDVLIQRTGKLCENVELFDVYVGAQVLAGYKSMAYKVTLRAQDHTLTDDEINGVVKKILNGLERMGVSLRS
ncbi:phenylalanine--tRNA ligase subunit beta [Oribacterium sp. P6A1]|uniref:phenylalanine--tRNA ligase subunit beta n=1 Tax=Oribacterium sp. P6A1 TaxID=1410612 RepID=UPI0005622B96|nr:phenylalanine--tRNA ligase subunit beta [Oribacterium sp. P6A1]